MKKLILGIKTAAAIFLFSSSVQAGFMGNTIEATAYYPDLAPR
jgi:hypothetical protein